jgi:hypothetical protein
MSEILVSKESSLRGIPFFYFRFQKGLHEGISRLPNYHTLSYILFDLHTLKVRTTYSSENQIK